MVGACRMPSKPACAEPKSPPPFLLTHGDSFGCLLDSSVPDSLCARNLSLSAVNPDFSSLNTLRALDLSLNPALKGTISFPRSVELLNLTGTGLIGPDIDGSNPYLRCDAIAGPGVYERSKLMCVNCRPCRK